MTEEEMKLRYGRDISRSMLQGATMGWSDEFGSLVGAGMAKGAMGLGIIPNTGESYTSIYRGMQKQTDQEQNQFRNDDPALALKTELLGGVAPAFASGGATTAKLIVPSIRRQVAHVGKEMGETGVASALYGAGSATEEERAGAGLHHAVTGAGIGAGAGMLGNVGMRSHGVLRNAAPLLKELLASGRTDDYHRLLQSVANRSGMTLERAKMGIEKYLGTGSNVDTAQVETRRSEV